MKFSCPSCQAKYQIADEKVSGRSKKMKCRKCGAIIPVVNDASIVETDAARLSRLPDQTTALATGTSGPGAAPQRAAPARPAPKPATSPLVAKPARPEPKSPLSPRGVPQSISLSERSSEPSASSASEAPAPDSWEPASGSDLMGPPSLRHMASRAPQAIPEWHAGIDGQAVGPLTREELRQKVREDQVHRDTLVWREGMTGWVALGDVTDLADLLVPVAMIAPAPLIAPAILSPSILGHGGASGLSHAPAAPTSPIAVVAPEPFGLEPILRQATPVVGGAGARALFPGPAETDALVPAPSPYDIAPIAPAPDLSGSGPFVTSSMPPRPSMWARARVKPVSKVAIGFAIAGALAFGMTMGFVIFGGQKTKIIKQIIEVPAKVAEGDIPAPPPETNAAGTPDPAAATGPTKVASGPKSGGSTPSGSTAPAGDGGLKGLSGLQGLGSTGPQGGPATTGAASSSGQPLDASQIQSTVAQYQNNVKRACWQPALDTRDKNAPMSARVTVSITVAGSGAVQGVSSTGDPSGYRGLAGCIERRVSTWTFPRSSGTTTVKVPFVFAAQ